MTPPVALLLAAALLPAAPPTLSPALRERIDESALRLPGDTTADELRRSAAELPLALLGAEGMTAEEEYRLAAAAHERLVGVRPAPAEATRVFGRLVAELPAHLKPEAFRYGLTVLDLPNDAAFTDGGGFVYLTRPRLSALLADPKRGEAALAFALADEIAHVALGHSRRGWELRRAAVAVLEYVPWPRIEPAGAGPRPFFYTPAERYDADRFALHLCRNAGFDLEAAPDALRLVAAREQGYDDSGVQLASFSERDGETLDRLKRVLQERDGLFYEEEKYGLFAFDQHSGRLARCGPRQAGTGERPIVLVHGMRGNEYALGDYLFALAARPEFADRPLLVFRYPNNGSLSRAGQLLTREMRRCVAAPDAATFICHSAGGLVFRWYAEVRHGGFDRAIFLAVPQAGARMAEFKGFVDVGRALLDLPAGLRPAAEDAFDEGDGQIAHDLHPDSLFLRRLGRETPPVARYRIFYGRFLDPTQTLAARVAFAVLKGGAHELVGAFVPFAEERAWLTRRIEAAALPEAVADGDLVVSARSAVLPGATATALPLHHEAFRYDPDLIRRVLAVVAEP